MLLWLPKVKEMTIPISDIYSLKTSAIRKAFTTDCFAFWMSCAYLFFEYVRPQAIWPVFEAYPYWARTFIILAFLGWLADPKRQFIWNRITTGVFGYLLLVLFSSYFAYWPDISWAKFMEYFNWVVVFFVLTQTVNTRQRFFIFLLVFLVASFKLSFYGARTFALRGFRFADWGLAGPHGYFQNPGELAIQMLVFAPMALFFTLGIKSCLKRWQVYFLTLMPITAALTVIGTNTRGGQLALATQLIALIVTTKKRLKMLIVIVIIGLVGYRILPAEQKARFEIAGDDLTSVQRLLYFKHGWQMIKDHPLLGVGYFNFAPYFTIYHSEDLVLERLKERGAELPHNIFIQVGTDTGFTGLSVMLGLVSMGFLSMRRLRILAENAGDIFLSSMAKGMNLALLGYIIAGQFVTVTYYPFLWVHLAFVVAMETFWKSEKNDLSITVPFT